MGKDAETEIEVSLSNSFSGKMRIERSTSPKVIVSAEVTLDIKDWKKGCSIVVDGINTLIEEAAQKELLPM